MKEREEWNLLVDLEWLNHSRHPKASPAETREDESPNLNATLLIEVYRILIIQNYFHDHHAPSSLEGNYIIEIRNIKLII